MIITFFLNANLLFQSKTFFLQDFQEKSVFVQHPGYQGKRSFIPRRFEYNSNITCSMSRSKLFSTYVQGTLWGGDKTSFRNICGLLKEMVEFDTRRGFMARVHDESYLNWYFHYNKLNSIVLDAGYSWPEEWQRTKNINILSRDKRKYLGNEYLKKLKA